MAGRALLAGYPGDTAFTGRLDCTEIGDVTHRVGIRRVELGGYLSDSPSWSHHLVPPTAHRGFVAWWVRTMPMAWNGKFNVIRQHIRTLNTLLHHVSTDTAFRAWLECTKTDDVIQKNSPGRNSMGRTRRILFRLSRMVPLPGFINCTQGVRVVVRFDCADGLERIIQRYAATRPYSEDTFIKSWELCAQNNYR